MYRAVGLIFGDDPAGFGAGYGYSERPATGPHGGY